MPANEVHFLSGHHFTLTHNRSCERTACFNINDVQSLNVVTMMVSWLNFLIWCLCFGLLTKFERRDHCLYGGWGGRGEGRGVVNNVLFTYTTYNIIKKFFFTCYGERFTFCFLCQILLSDFWNFLYQTYNINFLILSFGPNIWGGAITTSFL